MQGDELKIEGKNFGNQLHKVAVQLVESGDTKECKVILVTHNFLSSCTLDQINYKQHTSHTGGPNNAGVPNCVGCWQEATVGHGG